MRNSSCWTETLISQSNKEVKLQHKKSVKESKVKVHWSAFYGLWPCWRNRSYFVKHHSDSTSLIDNIFVMFGGHVFQQTVGIPMGTNCAPLLADLFLYLYEADFIQGLLKKNKKKLARSFNFAFFYIYDVLSLHNSIVRWFCWSHLSHWAWNKGYHRYR
jgi:hypothetical protein